MLRFAYIDLDISTNCASMENVSHVPFVSDDIAFDHSCSLCRWLGVGSAFSSKDITPTLSFIEIWSPVALKGAFGFMSTH